MDVFFPHLFLILIINYYYYYFIAIFLGLLRLWRLTVRPQGFLLKAASFFIPPLSNGFSFFLFLIYFVLFCF